MTEQKGHARYCTCGDCETRWAEIEADARRYRAVRLAIVMDCLPRGREVRALRPVLEALTEQEFDNAADALVKTIEKEEENR